MQHQFTQKPNHIAKSGEIYKNRGHRMPDTLSVATTGLPLKPRIPSLIYRQDYQLFKSQINVSVPQPVWPLRPIAIDLLVPHCNVDCCPDAMIHLPSERRCH
jgi:hypothetical protein